MSYKNISNYLALIYYISSIDSTQWDPKVLTKKAASSLEKANAPSVSNQLKRKISTTVRNVLKDIIESVRTKGKRRENLLDLAVEMTDLANFVKNRMLMLKWVVAQFAQEKCIRIAMKKKLEDLYKLIWSIFKKWFMVQILMCVNNVCRGMEW